MRVLAAIFLLLLGAAPVEAAATDWAELAPDTRIRLIASETWSGEGRTMIALELDMPANTKTYWRVPGETGIPTELDLGGSSGVTGQEFIWPYPQIEQQAGYTDFVYYGPTIIPVELTVEHGSPVIEASILMGICSDICVPATAKFTLHLAIGRNDIGSDLRIAQALALAPVPWRDQPDPVGGVTFDERGGGISIAVDPGIVDPASVIADASGTGHILGAPQKSPEPGVVVLPLLGGGDGPTLQGQSILITYMTDRGPFETWRQVGR